MWEGKEDKVDTTSSCSSLPIKTRPTMPPRKPIKATKKPAATSNNDAGALVENGSVPENRSLKPREAELFRDCLTKYENKEYTSGLEKVEEVLKVKPDHGGEPSLFLSLFARTPPI